VNDAQRHLYVHVPFCDGKCAYCAFYSERWRRPAAEAFLDALARELDLRLARGARPRPETIYCGGGTPAVLPADQLARLCALLAARCDLRRLREWTLEANPGSFTPPRAERAAAAGVTRVSLGAQCFDDAVLRALGRRHTVRDIARSVRLLRAAGIPRLGIDLIAGLPGLSAPAWERTLEQCLALAPDHVSVYALTLEPRTPLREWVRRKRVRLPTADEQTAALERAEAVLSRAGWRRYEISNYARPGAECRHNLAFWRGGDYLGFGPAAASREGRCRRLNRPSLARYIAALRAGREPPAARETLTPAQDAAERLAFAFRLAEGVPLERFCRRFAVPSCQRQRWLASLERWQRHGIAVQRGARWQLTARGRDLADAVAAELL